VGAIEDDGAAETDGANEAVGAVETLRDLGIPDVEGKLDGTGDAAAVGP